MAQLPVIVGMGGINAAGRSSAHHAYRRKLLDVLPEKPREQTYRSLAALMGMDTDRAFSKEQKAYMQAGTLIRRIEKSYFDVNQVPWNKSISLQPDSAEGFSFCTRERQLPETLPPGWQVSALDGDRVQVRVQGESEWLLPTSREFTVHSAGQLPSGFRPDELYQSRNHPRGLQLTVFGASDAINSMGIDWDMIQRHVDPDQISVYACSSLGQLDIYGHGGMVQARANGRRVTSKQCPLGYAQMHADFINAYLLGNVGQTGGVLGACATFLYNLRQGISDIRNGVSRVAIVGAVETPVMPEVMEGFMAMGALATREGLLALDAGKQLSEPDYARACRPFSSNCGFTIAEGAQFVVLFDDELALSLGANILGAVDDVFVNADGRKKSISAPGIGNYVTLAKALASARSVVGDEALRRRSFVQAHGTGTPQNRVTESALLNEVAKFYGIDNWLVSAVKCYVGHTIAAAAGDQLAATLGTWQYGWVPGIATIDHLAEDVSHSNLQISAEHSETGTDGIDVALINSKGFGGNNASAAILAPHIVEKMLRHKHGAAALKAYHKANENVAAATQAYDEAMLNGQYRILYQFDHEVLDGSDVHYGGEGVQLAGYPRHISLDLKSRYADLLDK